MLRGWEQWELNELLDEAEVGKDMASRLETDATKLPGPRRDAVAKVLGVQPDWFTAPVDQLLAVPPPEGSGESRQA